MELKKRGKVWTVDYYDEDTKKRVRKSLRTEDEKEARKRLAKLLIGELDDGSRGLASGYGPTLSGAYKRCLLEYSKWRDAKSPRTLEGVWRAVAEHFGEDTRLSDIDTAAITRYSAVMREQGLSGSTINQRHSFLSVLFKQAICMWDYKGLAMPRFVRAKVNLGRTRRISPEEEAEVIRLFQAGHRPIHPDMADLVAVLADTGMRLSEALRICDRDYDLQGRFITCWENKASHPKVVPMTARVHRIMTQRAGSGMPFGMLDVSVADREWAWVRTKMGLDHDKEFVLHTLRHTTASRLADSGADAFLIQRFMGHKSILTTQKYVHVSPTALRGLAGALEAQTQRDQQPQNPRDQGVVEQGHKQGSREGQAVFFGTSVE
ncbi:tyrosine-type recombinase/integrase [Burkholderia cenocepacia]|uniref:tyrosine-type recombinase/integrase n=1 Tax=Burkholderia cenocepacia TaxID=95486 RepID=UPI0023B88E8B|nr:site-specific integrase [Burkholderia cenocepacia]MDF0504827.1 tyrosine-type recombinase/integrase [Burkholderia cenocepacia]